MSEMLWLYGRNAVIVFYPFVFILGLLIGSFLNVCIFRIPLGQGIVIESSHCMKCGHKLKWYELIPLFSWLIQGGRCRACKEKISIQYPLVEFINAVAWFAIAFVYGFHLITIVYCSAFSILLIISVIDERTHEINLGLNIALLVVGIAATAIDYQNWLYHLIGMVSVSVFLLIIVLVSKERAMGLGDVYLMIGAGLMLGWKHTIFAFAVGCILGSIIHLIRMAVSKKKHELAFGPYLSLGIVFTVFFGNYFITLYSNYIMNTINSVS